MRDPISGAEFPSRRIRGGAGLGDALYLRPVVEYFLRQGDEVTVCSDYPDVFIGTRATVERFNRTNINVTAHYTAGKANPSTTQWQDICRSAGIPDIPLRFHWTIQRRMPFVEGLLSDAHGRQIVLVSGGRAPMGRTDGFGMELMPERQAFETVLASLRDCFTVRIGKGPQLYPIETDASLHDSTTVADLLDIAQICSGIVGQCSFAVPLAECFDKPLLAVWSAAGLRSREPYVSRITPEKVLHKTSSHFVVDDWGTEHIQQTTRTFREFHI